MKAEHRHELKTNELAQWIANFPNWAKENMRMIIYVSVVLILLIGVYAWKAYQKNVIVRGERQRFTNLMAELGQGKAQIARLQAEGTDYSYALLQTAKKLQSLARTTRNVNMAAMALIKRAEALRCELHYRMGPVDQRSRKNQIAQAKSAYEEAADKAQASPTLRASATFGLGLCEEELGNFDQARQIYTKVSQDPNFAVTTAAASAEYRLEIMDEYRQKLTFKKPVQPALPSPIPMEAPLPTPAVNIPVIEPVLAAPNEPAGE